MIALEKQLAVVDAELAKLPENQERVLRYIERLNWRKMSEKKHYSEMHCQRLAKLTILIYH